MLPRQLTLPPHPPAKLTPSLSHSCSLLCASKKVNPHQISNFQPLFAKHPGWGYLGVSPLLESTQLPVCPLRRDSFFTPPASSFEGSLEGLAPLAQSLERSAGCEGLQHTSDSCRARRSGGGTVSPQTALESTLVEVCQNK